MLYELIKNLCIQLNADRIEYSENVKYRNGYDRGKTPKVDKQV